MKASINGRNTVHHLNIDFDKKMKDYITKSFN